MNGTTTENLHERLSIILEQHEYPEISLCHHKLITELQAKNLHLLKRMQYAIHEMCPNWQILFPTILFTKRYQ
jgi:hypothetical protein